MAEPFEGGDGVEWFVLPEAEAVTTVHAEMRTRVVWPLRTT